MYFDNQNDCYRKGQRVLIKGETVLSCGYSPTAREVIPLRTFWRWTLDIASEVEICRNNCKLRLNTEYLFGHGKTSL